DFHVTGVQTCALPIYYFDQGALLHGLAQANQWQVAVLVDEAHNLVQRARRMYSAELDPQQLRDARRVAPPGLKPLLTRVARHWQIGRASCRERGSGPA